MVALDTSVFLYAVNRHAPQHARAARVVEELAQAELPWGVPSPVVLEFVRRVTHPHAIARPLRPADAAGFMRQVLEAGSARVLSPGGRFPGVLAELLEEAGGMLPEGIEIAAILREHGVRELLSCDPGMRRYRFLTVLDPVHDESWHPASKPVRRYRTLDARASG